ncbi:TPA: hypothetical protein ACHOYU_004183 [Raoultella planticola]|uniref:hypothetical protein n=1 Tax=Raoultella ornithinolytica TaxID=54291 RepID=UPI002FF3F8DC
MTDITELVPAMKAAAEKYRLTLEAHRNNPRDYDSVAAWDEATSEFMELVDSDELNIISGLVEVLEKALQRNGELEEAEQKLCAANVTLDARAELAERQMAELESRTVKLPEAFYPDGDIDCPLVVNLDDVKEMLTTTGINWEAE